MLHRKLYLDLDGVLADFDSHYAKIFGPLPTDWRMDKDHGNVEHDKQEEIDWKTVRDSNFFANIPLMPDAIELWEFAEEFRPTILTGCPKVGYEEASKNKKNWVKAHFGKDVPVITCFSKEKSKHCVPGSQSILVDDWDKYKSLWVNKGGIWITHRNAKETINLLRIFLPVVDLTQ